MGGNAVPMRYVSFSDASGKPRPGVIEGDSIKPFGPEVASLDAFVKMSPADRKAAVAKLGAVREGVLRRDRRTWTGYMRDSVVFYILDREWPTVKAHLAHRLKRP